MKFLVIGKLREYPPVPPKQYVEMYIGECQTVMGFKKEGKTDVSYALAGMKAGMGMRARAQIVSSWIALWIWS